MAPTSALAPIVDNAAPEEPEPMILSSGAVNHVHEATRRPNALELKFQRPPPQQLLPLPVSNLPDLPPVETKRPAVARPQKSKSDNDAEKENLWASGVRMPPELQWYFERVEAKYRCPQDEVCLPQLDSAIRIPVAAVTLTAAHSEPESSGFVKVKASAPIPSSVQHNRCFVLMKKLVGRTGPAQTYLAAHSIEKRKQREFGNYLVLRAYSKKDESSLTTFRRELAVFTRLSASAKEDCSARDGIVGLDASFVNAAKESWYFAMPLLRCNLAHVLTRERADVTDTVRHELSKSWITQLATGLDHLHNHGIIHSNLKPSNILLDWDGCVKISDFSCAYVHLTDEPLKSYPVRYTDKFCGSLPYMAPEQLAVLGLPSVVSGSDKESKDSKSMLMKKGFGKEADVWALGCVAAELCRDDHYKLVFESDADFEKFTKSSENDRREYLHQYAIPTHFQVEFILQLLEPNVSKRLKISEFKNTQYYKMNKNLTFSDYGKKKLRVEDIPDFILEFDLSKESIRKDSDVLVNVNLEDKHKDNLLGGEEVLPWIPSESRWAI